MSRQADPPERDADLALHRAYASARTAPTQWRVRYQLPYNDPRFLDATEEDIVMDLLEVMYVERLAMGPTAADAARDYVENQEVNDKIDAAIVASSTTGGLGKLLAAYAKRQAKPERKPTQVIRIMPGAGRRP